MATKLLAWQSQSKPYTKEEALALILETDLSREKYQKIRNGAQDKGSSLYVSWYAVSTVKYYILF